MTISPPWVPASSFLPEVGNTDLSVSAFLLYWWENQSHHSYFGEELSTWGEGRIALFGPCCKGQRVGVGWGDFEGTLELGVEKGVCVRVFPPHCQFKISIFTFSLPWCPRFNILCAYIPGSQTHPCRHSHLEAGNSFSPLPTARHLHHSRTHRHTSPLCPHIISWA